MPTPRTLTSLGLITLSLLACSGDDKIADDTALSDDSGQTDDSGVQDDSAEPEEAWAWCPEGAPSGDDDWSERLAITEGALYCGASDEGRSLIEEIDAKAKLRLMSGALPIPTTDVEGASISLPACVMLDDGQQGLVSDGEATLTTNWNEYGGETYYLLSITQPMRTPDGEPWVLGLQVTGHSIQGIQTIDGEHLPTFGDHGLDAWICEGERCDTYSANFRSCHFDGVDTDRHTLTFDGGQLQLDLRIGQSFASTEPSAFIGASGQLDGQTFTQTDYWQLVYNPTHHHFTRDFIALFDDPIGDACGLSALELDPWGDDPPPELHLVDCDGQPIEERTITDDTHELLP